MNINFDSKTTVAISFKMIDGENQVKKFTRSKTRSFASAQNRRGKGNLYRTGFTIVLVIHSVDLSLFIRLIPAYGGNERYTNASHALLFKRNGKICT